MLRLKMPRLAFLAVPNQSDLQTAFDLIAITCFLRHLRPYLASQDIVKFLILMLLMLISTASGFLFQAYSTGLK